MSEQSKIALVTGGSRGLGKNMALKIARKGLDVVLTYNNKKEKALEVVAEIEQLGQKAIALQLDTADIKSFDSFFELLKQELLKNFGIQKINYLVNNAGIGINSPFMETTEEDFDTLFNIQFKGVYFLTQKALGIIEDGGGIINISTGLTRFSLSGYSAYASVKGAIEVLTKYQAKELGTRGIRSNVIAPGAIATDFNGGVVRDNEQVNKIIAETIPLGRVGLPDDIGGVVAFLCTEDARWVNAQRIEVSGGQNI